MLAATAVVAGCVAPLPSAEPPEHAFALHAGPLPAAPVVVAVLDSGVNPYHRAFAWEEGEEHPGRYLPGYPPDARRLDLHLEAASYEAAVAADRTVWEGGIAPRELHWIPGTRIVGAISFGDLDAATRRPILDDHRHGTATASVVLAEAPGALLVVVETSPQVSEALAWVVEQPWIDLVSISLGTLLNLPLAPVDDEARRIAALTRAAHDAGMLVVVAAGNQPTPGAGDAFDGPPWVIAVGGALASAHGEVAVASKGADVVSAYRQPTASHVSLEERVQRSGTSFAAPTVAGALAGALQLLREDAGHEGGRAGGPLVRPSGAGGALAARDLREALNASAVYWPTTAWSPELPPTGGEPLPALDWALRATVPILPTPWLQMGWGYADGATAEALAEAARQNTDGKPPAAAAHMALLLEARCALWCDSS